MKIAVVSGGKSAINFRSISIDNERYSIIVYINDGIDMDALKFPDCVIFAARDACMIRKYSHKVCNEIWSCPVNERLIRVFNKYDKMSVDISPERIGYSCTATATLFTVFDQFRAVATGIDLFGFDMQTGHAISNTSMESDKRWQQERQEFDAILKHFSERGIQVNDYSDNAERQK